MTGSTDSYVYTSNGSGNTPILDQVNLGVVGTRDYTWDAAGNLDQVAAGANVIDFQFDQASRLAAADRTAAGQTAGFLYDGRGFLTSRPETAGGTAQVDPVYDSTGLVHELAHQASPTDPVERTIYLYLAGRPVAQLAIDGAGATTWTYLTADHLGTPLLATDATGAVVWQGGFEPFGTDYQARGLWPGPPTTASTSACPASGTTAPGTMRRPALGSTTTSTAGTRLPPGGTRGPIPSARWLACSQAQRSTWFPGTPICMQGPTHCA